MYLEHNLGKHFEQDCHIKKVLFRDFESRFAQLDQLLKLESILIKNKDPNV